MGKSWTGHTNYSQLAGELGTSDGRDFERKILPFLRLRWPAAVGSPALLSFDRAGIDAVAWSDKAPYDLVVQCKGFKVGEYELGRSQVEQCLASIASFRESGLQTKNYLLIHNRDGRSAEFRERIEAALDELCLSGQAVKAELWNRQRFMQEVFDAMLGVAREALLKRNLSLVHFYAEEEPLVEFVNEVPLASSTLLSDQHRLRSVMHDDPRVSDAALELFADTKFSIRVLIGEAGYGKTTTAYRAMIPGARFLYVPAARIPDTVNSSNDFLNACVDTHKLLEGFSLDDRPSLARLVPPVLHYLFKENQVPITVTLDGLDESIFFSRRGGIQWLFNMLRDVRVPVIMLARTEFWKARQQDFATAFGDPARKPDSIRRQEIRIFELLPWNDAQILTLAEKYHDWLMDDDKKMRIQKLIAKIRSGEYTRFYGDIPRRPLFLRLVLDTVAERDLHHVDRTSLFEEWARLKILRDIERPMRWGPWGRAPILSSAEGAETTLALAFLAMTIAARKMTRVYHGKLELWPSCDIEDILAEDRRLSRVDDPLGLFLNSLIVPVGTPGIGKQEVRFAHRAFQEFFLARDLVSHPKKYRGIEIPSSVKEWLTGTASCSSQS